MLWITIAFLVNLLIESSVSFSVMAPGDPIEAGVGSSVTLPCWISPAENAEALEIRWYRHNQFNNPVLFYRDGKIQEVQECFRNRSSLSLRSDQSGGLKHGDVSLRLEKLTFQDEGSFHCYVSGDTAYDSKVVHLKVTDVSSGPWKALFFTLLIFALLGLGLVVFFLYKYRERLTGKKSVEDQSSPEETEKLTEEVVDSVNKEALGNHAGCEDESIKILMKEVEKIKLEESTKHKVVGDVNIEELRKHADLILSEDCKTVRASPEYNDTGEEFPFQLCAFGAQRFSSGRHYWEVELRQENTPPKNYWLIGVVKDGDLCLRNKSTSTPFYGFWFLCSDGPNGIYTNTNPPVKLSLTPRPERLGVLLDYDDGELSFYNVTDGKHLLTISSRFTGPVVPLFNPGVGDQSDLRILV